MYYLSRAGRLLIKRRLKHKLESCLKKSLASNTDSTPSVSEDILKTQSRKVTFKHKLLLGPNLKEFFKDDHLSNQENLDEDQVIPYLQSKSGYQEKRKVFFDIYGCQMNVNDAEIASAILIQNGFERTLSVDDADVILIVTCAIRDSAEERIWGRLDYLKGFKKQRSKNRPSLKIGN